MRSLTTPRYSALVVGFAVMLLGCGADRPIDNITDTARPPGSTEAPSSIYFPMAAGNRWTYRNPDGSEWAREVARSEIILQEPYHSFSYHPSLADRHPDFIKSPTYVVASDGIFLQAKLIDVNDAIWQTVLRSNQERLSWASTLGAFDNGVYTLEKSPKDALVLLWYYKIKATEYNDFRLLHLPPDYPQKNQVFQMTIRGKHQPEIDDYIHEVEAKVNIWGYTSFEPALTTPAGRFENCLKIVYGTEISPLETLQLATIEVGPGVPAERLKGYREHLEHEISKELVVFVQMLKYNLKLQTMWLAPGVGPVKIGTPNGIAELIDYDIKRAQ